MQSRCQGELPRKWPNSGDSYLEMGLARWRLGVFTPSWAAPRALHARAAASLWDWLAARGRGSGRLNVSPPKVSSCWLAIMGQARGRRGAGAFPCQPRLTAASATGCWSRVPGGCLTASWLRLVFATDYRRPASARALTSGPGTHAYTGSLPLSSRESPSAYPPAHGAPSGFSRTGPGRPGCR